MSVTDEQIIDRLRVLLQESDLQTTTEKMLRKRLEEEFKMDMTEKKAIVRKEIEKYLEEQADDDEDDDNDEEARPSAPARGSSLGCLLSEPLQTFLGVEALPRTQVVKRLWEYIKANNLQDQRDKRKILLDDKLRTLFTAPLTMLTINTQLSRHCKTSADIQPRSRTPKATGGEKRAAEKPKADKPKADEPKAKKAKSAGGKGGEGGESGEKPKINNFNKPLRLSAELADWCGSDSMGRSDLTKFFWAYIKERNLRDPSNMKFVLCDPQLKKLTGESRIQAFAIQKYLSGHILKD